jgi:hypothetical protein
MAQSDLSKVERRTDRKISTLRAIAKRLGLRARIIVEDEQGRWMGSVASDSRKGSGSL